nr:beta-galactoside alpha-2,6-sialyltransferase 2-like [Lepeophtheirus salmonis]
MLVNGDLSFENYLSYREIYEDLRELEQYGFIYSFLSRKLQNVVIQTLYFYYAKKGKQLIKNTATDFLRKERVMDNKKMICDALKKVNVSFFMKSHSDVQSLKEKHLLPSEPFLNNTKFNTCALVGNAGSLIGSNLGGFIDSHDLVIRLNHAKTDGYGVDVGVKTDIRFVNSLLLKQNKFDYFNPKNMYQSKETTYVTFEVSRFNQGFLHWTITQKSFIDRYFKQRVFNKDQKFYMLDYRSLWSMQRWLSSLGKYPILNFIPSSGFIAFQTMLSHCDIIRLFEFIPSKRLTNLCHYFEKRRSITCTYAGDHSVSAEKLSYYFMGNRNRVEIFDKGYVTVDTRHCD